MDERLERRKTVNRGYRKLRTWQMAIELYAFLCEKVKEIPGSPYRLIAQILDAGSSISANIAEVLPTLFEGISLLSQCRLGICWGSLFSVLRMLPSRAVFRDDI